MKVDLHLHTTASDGRLTSAQVVAQAARLGLEVIAITDHDSTEGVAPALCAAQAFPGLMVIPGVEINTDIPQGEVHILGYFIRHHDPALQRTLQTLRHYRRDRAQRMIAKLANLGIPIEWERVQELAGGSSVGRPHIAQALFEKGYIPSLQDAFIRYIGRHGPAYAERYKITPAEAVRLIKGVGGLPVLAHPADLKGLETMIPQLIAAGLVGLEAYYNGYPEEMIGQMVSLARKYNLVATGGSDYHGLEGEPGLGSIAIPQEAALGLVALAESLPSG